MSSQTVCIPGPGHIQQQMTAGNSLMGLSSLGALCAACYYFLEHAVWCEATDFTGMDQG